MGHVLMVSSNKLLRRIIVCTLNKGLNIEGVIFGQAIHFKTIFWSTGAWWTLYDQTI
jgi:hypothetical protein